MSAVDENDVPVLWCLILEDKYESATELLKFAKENRILVTFRGARDDDLLWRAIADNSVECVKFVLAKLVERFTSLEETCYLLNLHFRKLIEEFPDLVWDYLHKDKFTIEYARFKIPKDLYVDEGTPLVAGVLTNYRLKDWEVADGDETKRFLFPSREKGWRRFIGKLSSTWSSSFKGQAKFTDTKITVVAKFFCISYRGSQIEMR